jgi:phosphate starvation-inducible PhoH-like protein
VEAGERLGFLPGDFAQKVDPYLRPLYDALYDLMGFDKTGKLFERNTIEIARSRTCAAARSIIRSSSSTSAEHDTEQMKMF